MSMSDSSTISPNITPPPKATPCPSCGRCPTCGKGGLRTPSNPYYIYPSPTTWPQPYWQAPTITCHG